VPGYEVSRFAATAAAWVGTFLPAATGKEQLCRCSAAGLEAPLFPGGSSSPPTQYCELCARI